MDPDPLSGSPPKFNHLFIGLLPTFPENPFGSFCTNLLTDTNNDDYISSLAEVSESVGV